MIMVSKRAPDCPCCGTNMVYKYPEEKETIPDFTTIICNGCNEDFVLNKAEIQALNYFMSHEQPDSARNVLLHQEDVSYWGEAKESQHFVTIPVVETPSSLPEEDTTSPYPDVSVTRAGEFGGANPGIKITPYGENPFYDSNYGQNGL